jgi:hypothetical protein
MDMMGVLFIEVRALSTYISDMSATDITTKVPQISSSITSTRGVGGQRRIRIRRKEERAILQLTTHCRRNIAVRGAFQTFCYYLLSSVVGRWPYSLVLVFVVRGVGIRRSYS